MNGQQKAEKTTFASRRISLPFYVFVLDKSLELWYNAMVWRDIEVVITGERSREDTVCLRGKRVTSIRRNEGLPCKARISTILREGHES